MDTFFEQIVPVRKDAKSAAAVAGLWFLAVLVSAVAFLFLLQYIGMMAFVLSFGAFYGAYKLSGRFNLEYEYIITNGTLDIDKIMAKSQRKRVLSVELSEVERLEKYNPAAKPVGNYKSTVIACNETSAEGEEKPYFMVVSKEGKGTVLLVMAPDERLRGAIKKFLPKFIANSAFRD